MEKNGGKEPGLPGNQLIGGRIRGEEKFTTRAPFLREEAGKREKRLVKG